MKHVFPALLVLTIVSITYLQFFPKLTNLPLQKWDEQTNVSVVTSTATLQNFPLLYKGEQLFFEKPPLWYWATIILNTHLSDPLQSGRIISATSGFLTLLLTTFLAWLWWGPIAGVSTWLALVTTSHFFVTNPNGSFSTHTLKSADLDSLHIFFLMLSFASLNWTTKFAAIISGISAGLSVLSKSPLGMLPLLVATIIPIHKHTPRNLLLSWVSAITIALPWYIWMTMQFHIPFLASHFGYHMTARMQYALEGHSKPIWYYVRILSERHFFLSWEWLVGSLLYITQQLYKNPKLKYTFFMAIATFMVPTGMSTKLAWYLLPFYPFAALLMGFASSALIRILIVRISRDKNVKIKIKSINSLRF